MSDIPSRHIPTPARLPDPPKRTPRRRPPVEERSAGGVVVRVENGDYLILLIRDPYDKWGLPKGHIEQDETGDQAAWREVMEETGLQEVVVGPELGTIDWHFRLKGKLIHKYCQFFLMATEDGRTCPEIEEGITECTWVPMDLALEQVTYDNAREMIELAAVMLEELEPRFPPWETS
jgi:8-oxo-dGTP pyrophosphatase MutT (NUDIX family)